jgi:hypothetical protein
MWYNAIYGSTTFAWQCMQLPDFPQFTDDLVHGQPVTFWKVRCPGLHESIAGCPLPLRLGILTMRCGAVRPNDPTWSRTWKLDPTKKNQPTDSVTQILYLRLGSQREELWVGDKARIRVQIGHPVKQLRCSWKREDAGSKGQRLIRKLLPTWDLVDFRRKCGSYLEGIQC